jgi:hypothetical protein
MDDFLGAVIDDYKAGVVTREQVVSGFAHVIAAVDIGNYGEARTWFREGRKFVRGALTG